VQRTYTELKISPKLEDDRDWPAWVQVPQWAKDGPASEQESTTAVDSSIVLEMSLLTYPGDRPLEWTRHRKNCGPDGAVFTIPHFSPFLLESDGFSILSPKDAEDLIDAAAAQLGTLLTTRLLLENNEPAARGITSSDTGPGVVFFAKPLVISDYDATFAFSLQGARHRSFQSDEPLILWNVAGDAKLAVGQRYAKAVTPANGDHHFIVLLHIATISHTGGRDETHAAAQTTRGLFGAKATDQGSTPQVLAAVAHTIANGTGVWIEGLPITSEKVLNASRDRE
jgi:hypothetical protein